MYEGCAGVYGLTTWDDCIIQAIKDGNSDPDDELIQEYYDEAMSSWINVRVEPDDSPVEYILP